MLDTLDIIINAADTVATVVDPAVPAVEEGGNFFAENWGELLIGLLAFAKIVVNLTPTEKDNMVFGWIDTLINTIVADRRKA